MAPPYFTTLPSPPPLPAYEVTATDKPQALVLVKPPH